MLTSNSHITELTTITLSPSFKQRRIWELDFMRGFCVVLMIFDHLALLLGLFFGPSWYGLGMLGDAFGPTLCRLCEYYYSSSLLREIGHPIILFIFFSISGISCSLSRSNKKRGLQLLAVALIYSFCSYIGQEFMGIGGILTVFGVLNFLAVSILLYAFICFLSRGNKWFKMAASAIIIIVTLCLYHLYTPPESTPQFFAIFFPPTDIHGNSSLFYSQMSFSPGDLFTLIPYSAFFFFGTFIAPLLYANKCSFLPVFDHAWHKPISFIGRHALVIYIAHVVLIAAILALISYIFITPGDWGI